MHNGSDNTRTKTMSSQSPIHADYLVVGAGTAGMSFVDTLLTEDADATVILVDRNAEAGGHWTMAYPHVRLHQPAAYYGVNSLPLGRSRNKRGNERYDIDDRSSGREIVEYYARVAQQFRKCGRVRLCLGCEYAEAEGGRHTITSKETGEATAVTCLKVVVTISNVVVPSMRGPPFPVDGSVKYAPCNALPELVNPAAFKKYVVIGAGKTGMDSVTHLLRAGVDPSAITWIVSRDVWVFLRECMQRKPGSHLKDMGRFFSPLLRCSSFKEVWKEYERDGIVARIDQDREPTVFKGAAIDGAELAGLRTVKNVVRMGRVTSIVDGSINMEGGTLVLPSPAQTLLVDCMADMDRTFYGYCFEEGFKFFPSKGRINVGFAPTLFNPSFGSALVAYVEATFSDEMDKDSLLFLPRKFGHDDTRPEMLFHMMYLQSKTFAAVSKAHKPAGAEIILGSRTYGEAPMHNGGLRSFLWAMFGPPGIRRKGNRFVKKIETGGFAEVPDYVEQWGGRALPAKSEVVVKEGRGKDKKKSNYPPPPEGKAKSAQAKRKKRMNRNSRSTANVSAQ